MDQRAAKLQDIKDKQNRWMRERQAELDRQGVMEELQPGRFATSQSQAFTPSGNNGGSALDRAGNSSCTRPQSAMANGSGLGRSGPGGRAAMQAGVSQSQQLSSQHMQRQGNGSPAGAAAAARAAAGASSSPTQTHPQQYQYQQAPGYMQQQQQNLQQQSAYRSSSYQDTSNSIVGGGGGGGGGSYQAQGPGGGGRGSNAYWAQVKPEEVIDRLTERITDRLRSELKVELQKESDTWQGEAEAGDRYLSKELEAQNTCPICYDIMVPPNHAPILLFPCGHTFCSGCITSHVERHHKMTCPICRKKIESRAPNYSLQQLILNWVGRQARVKAGETPPSPTAMSGGAGNSHSVAPATPQGGEGDRLRREADRLAMRLKVLSNEMLDTVVEEQEAMATAQEALARLQQAQAEQANIASRMRALQAELEASQARVEAAAGEAQGLEWEADAVRQRRDMLQATIEPLTNEVEKLEVLLEGLDELDGL